MSETLLRPEAAVVDGGVRLEPCIRIEGGFITDIVDADHSQGPFTDVSGTLLPGLIDLQVNGAAGLGVDEATPEALNRIAKQVADGAAAAFLPTLISAEFSKLREQIRAVADWISSKPSSGATPLGIHVEGPFLELHGAHDASVMLRPSPERVGELLEAGQGHIRLLTLAPEVPGAVQAVAQLRQAGVTVALGHGKAGKQTQACIEAGASMITHLFNACGDDHHRRPGLAGIALDDERLTCSLIADGYHVHPIALRNAYRCLGSDRFVLVTDAVSAMGMPDGQYHLAGSQVYLKNGIVRNQSGGLAGSAICMADAGENFLRWFPHLGPWSLAQAASKRPAELIATSQWGAIEVGKRARFAVLSSAGKLSSLDF